MSTYLSFDLDFFNYPHAEEGQRLNKVRECLRQLHGFAVEHRIPIISVMNHQQMLPFVDNSNCDVLLNVDTHSDLVRSSYNVLNCGTWISYVRWRKRGKYIWWHGSKCSFGDCNGDEGFIFRDNGTIDAGQSDWRRIRHMRTFRMPRLTTDIRSIGVCLSPMYVDSPHEVHGIFKEWIKRHNIPYVKGRWNENHERTLFHS